MKTGHWTSQPVRVAVVNGSPFQREVEMDLLHENGYQVTGFASADDVVTASSSAELPNLFLVNSGHQDEDGFASVQKIRHGFAHAAILMVISGNDAWRRAQAFKAGADNYLFRPYAHKELLAVFENFRRRL